MESADVYIIGCERCGVAARRVRGHRNPSAAQLNVTRLMGATASDVSFEAVTLM